MRGIERLRGVNLTGSINIHGGRLPLPVTGALWAARHGVSLGSKRGGTIDLGKTAGAGAAEDRRLALGPRFADDCVPQVYVAGVLSAVIRALGSVRDKQ